MTDEVRTQAEGLPLGDAPDNEIAESGLSTVAAAHAVFSGTRHATRLDLLISTIVELLRQSSMTLEEVHAGIAREWPGVGTSLHDVDEALQVAASAGHQLVVRAAGLTGELWHLTDHGRAEADTTREWIDGFRRRLVTSIEDRSAESFRAIPSDVAVRWAERLAAAITAGVAAADEAYLGNVDLLHSSSVLPVAADMGLIQQRVTTGVTVDVADFLLAAAIAALDPTDPFGNELVTVVSTSCVLHGFLARLDQAAAQEKLGSLLDQEVVLDTPILIALASGEAVRQPIERVLSAARDSGLKVLVLEHYLDEFADLVSGGEPPLIRELVSDPRQRAAFVALSERDSVQAAYAQSLAEGTVAAGSSSFSESRGYGIRWWILASRSARLGITTRHKSIVAAKLSKRYSRNRIGITGRGAPSDVTPRPCHWHCATAGTSSRGTHLLLGLAYSS